MGFWSALGAGLENYGKQRLARSRLGGFVHPQQPGINPPMDQQVATDDGSNQSDGGYSGMDAFAGGKIVTKPTTAIVGDHGPEAIVPLNSAPGQKLSPSMMGGPQNTKSRFRQVTGPNALKNVSPLKADLPLRPNRFVR